MPSFRLALPLSLLFAVTASFAQTPRTLKPEDYGQWELLRGARISNDGHWLAVWVGQVDADGFVLVRNVDTPEKWITPVGSMPAFSDDSRWCAYVVSPPKKDADRMREQKQPIENKLGLRDLSNGSEKVIDSVQAFRFLKGGRFLLVHHYRGTDKQSGGSDLDVLDLKNGSMLPIGNVVAYAPNEAEDLVALAIESDSKNKGVQLLDPAASTLKTLSWGKNDIANLAWAKKASALAFMVGQKDEKKEGAWNRIFLVRDVNGASAATSTFDPKSIKGFPEGKRIAEFGGLNVSDDGTAVAFGIRDWDDVRKPQGKPEERAQVDVWSGKDVDIQPTQKKRAPFDRQQTVLCVWTPADDRFVQVADDKSRPAVLARDFKHAVVFDDRPYRKSATNGIDYRDVWLVDVASGTRDKLLAGTQWYPSFSDTGRYITFYDKGDWWVFDTTSKARVNVTKPLGKTFADVDNDGTIPEKPAEGPAIWADGDAGLLLFDKYDTYLWTPGAAAARPMTSGSREQIIYRPLNLTPTEAIHLDKPMYFSMFGDVSKRSGFALAEPGQAPKTLIFDDKAMGNLAKAKEADRMIFSMQDFAESPNVFVTNGLFTQAKPVTRTNAQQANFLWGKSELIHYKSKWGKELQGTLIYPADYQPGKKYPMVVYIYERLSNGLHSYLAPSDYNAYNQQVFSQNGYFVLMPDIAYRSNQPGISAVECLEPAVQTVLKTGMIDPSKVGLMGHSWGAYQTTFVISQSKLFSAAVAGAPLTNLISMYGSIYWNSGTPDQELLETGQGRLGVPYWEDLKTYIANSPMFNAKNITAPLMIAFGDQDGAVDWHQGQELYTTMRRMGKDITMLVYADENHNYTKKPDQQDYAHRLRHFFDVHLKGAAPEPWLRDGVPFLKKDGS